MGSEDPKTKSIGAKDESETTSVGPGDQPGGLFPLGSIRGFPPRVRKVQAAGDVFASDAVRPTGDGSVASGGEPGRSRFAGVALNPSCKESPNPVHVFEAKDTIFLAFTSGDTEQLEASARRGPAYANLRFNSGNRISLRSEHTLDLCTTVNDDSRDMRIVSRICKGPKPTVETMFRRIQPLNSIGPTDIASRRLIKSKEAFERDIRIAFDQFALRGLEIGSISEEAAAEEMGTLLDQPNFDVRQLRRLRDYYYQKTPWRDFRLLFRIRVEE